MKPKFPSRSALLASVLSLGLLVPGLNADLTRAESAPEPCGLAAVALSPEAAADDLLLLSVLLPPEMDQVSLAAPGQPVPPAPPAPPALPGRAGPPKPPGTDLRPPDAPLLNLEPVVAARQLRESLSEQQKGDLRAVLTKHQGALQQARSRGGNAANEPRVNRPGQDVTPGQDSAAVQGLTAQVDQEIEPLLTPAQRALLQKARPKRLRSELPGASSDIVARGESAC